MRLKNSVRVTQASIPFSEIPEEKFPAVYFTRQGQHPVVVQERTPMGYSIRLWDGRESLCDRRRLEKTLEPEGFFIAERTPGMGGTLKKLFTALGEEKRYIALGIANGAINCSLLVVFIYLLHHVFQSAFPAAGMNSPGIAIAGIVACLLSCCGYLQARYLISTYFENLSDTNRAREMRMPPPYPIRNLTKASTGRIVVEAASAPFFLTAAAILVGYDVGSVTAWSALAGCSIPAVIFVINLTTVADRWQQAFWFFKEEAATSEESFKVAEPKEVPIEEPEPVIDSSIVRTHNLYLAHPEESLAPLLDHISLKIEEGEKVGFLGMSNSEVPVFLRVVSGLLNADRGIVWIDGKMVDGDQTNSIGWFSERALLLEGSLRENICLNRRNVPGEDQIQRVVKLTGLDQIEIFECEGLDAAISETGKEISEVDRIRILLTRSLIHQPNTLVFDSPRGTAGYSAFRQILEDYLSLEKCTLLLGAKHNYHLDLTDRTVIIQKGKVAQDCPTAEIVLPTEEKVIRKP